MLFRAVFIFSILFCGSLNLMAQINCPPNLPLTLLGNTSYCVGSPGSMLAVDETYAGYEWLPTAETGQSALLTAGDYVLVVTHYTGCTDTLEIEVEQVSNPPQPVINVSGPTQFCQGESVVLSGPAGYPYYEWNSGSVSNEITVFESGTFVISVKDWIGCVSSSNSVQIIVDPLPIAAFSPNLDLYDIVFNNLSQNATSYEWNFGDGAFSTDFEPSHVYNTDGTLPMWLVAFNDCGSDTAFLDLASVGLEERESVSNLSVYPNPSDGRFYLSFSSDHAKRVDIAMVDVLGRTVLYQTREVQTGPNTIHVDSGNVPDGLYHLELTAETTRSTAKLMVGSH